MKALLLFGILASYTASALASDGSSLGLQLAKRVAQRENEKVIPQSLGYQMGIIAAKRSREMQAVNLPKSELKKKAKQRQRN